MSFLSCLPFFKSTKTLESKIKAITKICESINAQTDRLVLGNPIRVKQTLSGEVKQKDDLNDNLSKLKTELLYLSEQDVNELSDTEAQQYLDAIQHAVVALSNCFICVAHSVNTVYVDPDPKDLNFDNNVKNILCCLDNIQQYNHKAIYSLLETSIDFNDSASMASIQFKKLATYIGNMDFDTYPESQKQQAQNGAFSLIFNLNLFFVNHEKDNVAYSQTKKNKYTIEANLINPLASLMAINRHVVVEYLKNDGNYSDDRDKLINWISNIASIVKASIKEDEMTKEGQEVVTQAILVALQAFDEKTIKEALECDQASSKEGIIEGFMKEFNNELGEKSIPLNATANIKQNVTQVAQMLKNN